MIGTRIVIKRGSKDEAEKPFWISFSDLMSALMVLFLVVMAVALLAVTRRVSEADRVKLERERAIEQLRQEVSEAAKSFEGVTFANDIVNFGERARFDLREYRLSTDQSVLLRSFVPKVLGIANTPLGKQWLKRVVVEGFTDQSGSYLYNLNLSLQRSQSVLCALLAPPTANEQPLTVDEKGQIQNLFLVGGYSSNLAKEKAEDSRRVEWRLEFLGIGEPPAHPQTPSADFGTCRI